MIRFLWLVKFVLVALVAATSQAAIIGPYSVDANTSHLWHFDDFSSPTSNTANDTVADDAATGGNTNNLRSSYWRNYVPPTTDERALASGTTLGNAGYFGYAANNTKGLSAPPLPGTTGAATMGLYPYLDPATATSDDVPVNSFFGTNGAFSIEGLFRVDWNPTVTHDAPYMQFMTMTDDSSTARGRGTDNVQYRVFELYLDFTAAGGGSATDPYLSFYSYIGGNSAVNVRVADALGEDLQQGAWYHVAATFTGVLTDADNIKLYLTKVEPSATEANLVATGDWTAAFPDSSSTQTSDFAVGNSGRISNSYGVYPGDAWFGLIDEVRISTMARGAREFIFVPEPSSLMLMVLGLTCAARAAGIRRRG